LLLEWVDFKKNNDWVVNFPLQYIYGGRRGHDHMVVGFKTTCAISAYHHYSCGFKPCSWRGVLDTTLCDKSLSVTWFSPGTPVSYTNKTDRHDITEILLKVALNTINHTSNIYMNRHGFHAEAIYEWGEGGISNSGDTMVPNFTLSNPLSHATNII
jgi:hypothetical protein